MNSYRKSAVFCIFISVLAWGVSHAGPGEFWESGRSDSGGAPAAASAVENDAGTQKERFLREAEEALEKLDRRIQALSRRMAEKWEQMEPRAKEEAERTLETMKKERQALLEKLNRLQEGSKEAWERMKNELRESYESLKEMLEKDALEPPENGETYI